MHQIDGHHIWIGHNEDARNLNVLLAQGFTALVDLSLSDEAVPVPREMVYCRFPLLDGLDNPPWLLWAAVHTVAALVRSRQPTLVACGAGLSRSQVVTAAALAVVTGKSPEECLSAIAKCVPHDVSPGLWNEVVNLLKAQSE